MSRPPAFPVAVLIACASTLSGGSYRPLEVARLLRQGHNEACDLGSMPENGHAVSSLSPQSIPDEAAMNAAGATALEASRH